MDNNRWLPFYRTYGITPRHEPNDDGWVNFPCILPTHGKADSGEHGAINVYSGNYRCFSAGCWEEALRRLNKPDTSQVLFPWEFLVLTQGLSREEAIAVVEEYRLSETRDGGSFQHVDLEVSRFQTLPRSVQEWVTRCQEELREDLDIVQEYMRTRNLQFETLKRHGVGYNSEDNTLIFPYYLDGHLTGVRVRLLDGRKRSVPNSHFPPYNLDAIDSSPSKIVIICEGETDTLYLSQELYKRQINIPVIGIPGASVDPFKWERYLQACNRILVIPHADKAGLRLATVLKEVFRERVEIIKLPWKPKQFGKDIVDFCRTQSPDIVIQELGLLDIQEITRPEIIDEEYLFKAAEAEPDWIVPGLIERGQKVLITGAPKTRKTLIALDLARSVTLCEPFMSYLPWRPTKPGTVLFVEEEGNLRELGDRLKRITDGRLSGRLKFLHRQGIRLDEPGSLAKLRRYCLQYRPDLLILDPLRNLHSRDENSAQEMAVVLDAIDSLLRTLPWMSIVVLHHSPKHSDGARGSGAIWASVDTQIQVTKSQGTTMLKIEGRSVADDTDSLQFSFDSGTLRHSPVSSDGKAIIRVGSFKMLCDRLTEFLRVNADRAFTIQEVDAAFPDLSDSGIRKALDQLAQNGTILCTGRGTKGDPFRYQFKLGVED